MEILNDRRLGKFSIHMPLINTHPDLIKEVMRKCIILKADYNFENGCMEYLAISDKFAKVSLGSIPMVYTILFEMKYDSRGHVIKSNWYFEEY